MIGGFTSGYNSASRSIQFFNIRQQKWMPERRLNLPPGIAETHQGVTFDPTSRLLYIVSGQLGGACKAATTAVVQINVDTGTYKSLPPLPAGRYFPGVAIISHQEVKHLHVFGGASEMRNQSATDHWRLTLAQEEDRNLSWQEIENVPDGGAHGLSISHGGYIYYTGFSTMDQGVLTVDSMQHCQETAYNRGQLLHHSSDVGFFFRYDPFSKHWERLPDMPFAAAHTGHVLGMNKLILISGGLTTYQTKIGSAPTSLNMVQMFNFNTLSWAIKSFDTPKDTKTYRMSMWIDYERSQIFGLRAGETVMSASFDRRNLSLPLSAVEEFQDDYRSHKLAYLEGERSKMVDAITTCLNSGLLQLSGEEQSMVKHTIYDTGYEDVRATWNKRTQHLQYPDIVTFPKSAEQVSLIVQCAKRTGHHLCARNGKHSFEGDSSCTYGIVVDVAKMSSVKVLDHNRVRFGSGLHLGRVAVELEKIKRILPMGHCASVGLTGKFILPIHTYYFLFLIHNTACVY